MYINCWGGRIKSWISLLKLCLQVKLQDSWLKLLKYWRKLKFPYTSCRNSTSIKERKFQTIEPGRETNREVKAIETIKENQGKAMVCDSLSHKVQYFIKIIFLPSIKKLKFSHFLYYFNELFILF